MKRGFTLIELLAVITILSIIVLVASISVANMLKESKNELSNAQLAAIKKAAESWGGDNVEYLPTNNSCSFITLKDLKEDGLLDSNIINPKDKSQIFDAMLIKIESRINDKGKSVLTYEVDSKDVKECSYIGSSIYVDVPEGLTPVIYDGENWKVPETNEEWYNYDKQMWANAVVLGKGKTKKPGEKVSVEGDNPDVLMMLVYIPRFEYKIEGQYGTHTDGTEGTQELPGEIEVKFINNSKTTADEGYILHPAFKFGDQEVSGIWVGKFEISHITLSSSRENDNLQCSTVNCTNAEGLRVLPNVQSLRANNVSNFWYGIKSIENTSIFGLSNMDTHMMKNSEWGAVAYLSQSKYGKYGNKDYEGAQREIYTNNSSSYYTGRSGGNPGGNTKIKDTYADQNSTNWYSTYGFYTYDGYLLKYDTNNKTTRDLKKGTGASTTGTIYGIYDMSGGAWEYVMGVYGTEEDGIYSGYSVSQNSGFNGKTGHDNGEKTNGHTLPNLKYYNLYNTNNYREACGGQICYGHALSETSYWYGDAQSTINEEYPWIIRGDFYMRGNPYAGIFYYGGYAAGESTESTSTRVVGIVE